MKQSIVVWSGKRENIANTPGDGNTETPYLKSYRRKVQLKGDRENSYLNTSSRYPCLAREKKITSRVQQDKKNSTEQPLKGPFADKFRRNFCQVLW